MEPQIEQGYAVVLPTFYPDPWPTALDLETLRNNAVNGKPWTQVVAEFKQTHHVEAGQWVANV